MMYKKPSRRWVALKAAYLLPLGALALVAFARPQTLSEIEEKVEKTVPSVVDVIKTLAQPRSDEYAIRQQEGEGELKSPTQDSRTAYSAERDTLDLPDSNLIKADLAESGRMAVVQAKSATELLDSTMQAVGAQKIADGTYVGHFQPSLASDTVRIALATILDRESKQTGEHSFTQNADCPDAYNITLNAETRKDCTGYYIRYLQPVRSTLRNYDRTEVDPNLLSTDSVLTGRSMSDLLLYHYLDPIAIERNKKETRIFMYIPMKADDEAETVFRDKNSNLYKDLAIVDDDTGDKYVCRAMDYAYFKHVKDEVYGKDTINIYQTCLVFPPIGKRVKEAHFGRIGGEEQVYSSFELNEIPRKGRVITR